MTRHTSELTVVDPCNKPGVVFLGIFKELLIFFERAATGFWTVSLQISLASNFKLGVHYVSYPRPPGCK